MEKEPKKFDKKELSRGDIELNKIMKNKKGVGAKAYYYYVRDNDIEGLYKLAKLLEKKKKKKDAAAVLAKAHQLYNDKNGNL